MTVARSCATPTRVVRLAETHDASRQAYGDASGAPTERVDPREATCRWCGEPIPAAARRESIYCSRRCRQSAWRFARGMPMPTGPAGRPLRLAYADPPYPGMAARYYGDHPDYEGEVDHAKLIADLCDGYDGWALSTSSRSLRDVLAICPDGVRVGAWTKPVPPGYTMRPRSAWEPVLFYGGRPLGRDGARVLDWVHAAPMRRYAGAITGTKPSAFSFWVFASLGAQACDSLADLFPGSGAVGHAWREYVSRLTGGPRRVGQLGETETVPDDPACAAQTAPADLDAEGRPALLPVASHSRDA